MPFTAEVRYEEHSQVWYVHASDLPGLHAEAATLDDLVAIIEDVTPDLAAGLPDTGEVSSGTSAEVAISVRHLVVARRAHAA